MTCASCLHSRYQHGDKRLWCALHQGPCLRVCADFTYEPGTDEGCA